MFASRTGWVTVSALALAAVLGNPLLAQSDSFELADARLDSNVVPQAAPDPLTPPRQEAAPVTAPGAPAAAAQPAKPSEPPDPIVAEVRRVLADGKSSAIIFSEKAGAKADRAAVEAFYAEGEGKAVWTSPRGLTRHGEAAVKEMTQRAADYGLDAKTFAHLKNVKTTGTSVELAETEIRIALAALAYARQARGGRVNPGSLSPAIDREAQIYEPRSLLAALAASDEADIYLRQLHPKHPQFQRLQQALMTLRTGGAKSAALGLVKGMSATDAEQRILINMERWRWLPDDMGEMHVWNNVPEQITRVIHGGKTVLTERIVVGKLTQQTPEFSAPMRFVIFHPSWGVPDGVKTIEISPMLKQAGSNGGAGRALKPYDLRVYQNGREMDPDKINWHAVDIRQYQFKQPPGPKSVLGVVKFRFPNKFDVYMHDTQDRHLFGHSPRAYSHGCMRVQNPLRMAETILAYDKGWSAERVAAFVPKKQTADITLEKPVNVHITYFTAVVDDDGKLRFLGDIYNRDSRVASALTGKPVAIASVGKALSAHAAQPPRPSEQAGAARQSTRTARAEPKQPLGPRLRTTHEQASYALRPQPPIQRSYWPGDGPARGPLN